ncbi:cytochrome ubiquinol oxidase subunit I [Vibrio profundi]|uniref:cytochrome ubiquinol oxidase subunit I n=1 Tax=Vibrio profundi TaxID=1774960 RepID=UPI00373699C2
MTFLTHKRDHVYYALYRDSHQQVMTLALQESALLAIPLPWIACEAGWFVAEFGRQPWAIGEVLPVNMAASNLPASSIWLSLAAVYILYTLFLIIEMYLLVKFAKRGPSALKTGRLSSCQLFLFTPYGVIAKCLDA